MARVALADLAAIAAESTEPAIVSGALPKPGGVDPLGLRQINFDLMDQVLPGINNVARHVRPFVLVTWAWRRAKQLAERGRARELPVDTLRDFVDRIEVIYAWSQFLRDPDADLPGRQVLEPLIHADRWDFGGRDWKKRREVRCYSTAFTAPINYGPALKTLGWVLPHREHSDVLLASEEAQPALDAFEARILDRLDHPAFSRFGKVVVTAKEARSWAEAWALDQVTKAEQTVMAKMLFGSGAPTARRNGGALMLEAIEHIGGADVLAVRRAMAGSPSNFAPSAECSAACEAWRRVQVRQLFRFALEALFHWTVSQLVEGPKSSSRLVDTFLDQTGRPMRGTARQWLDTESIAGKGPIELINDIERSLENPSHPTLAQTIAAAIAFSIAEAPEHEQLFERADRLPLARARRETEAWAEQLATDFVKHILESWVLAQHVYWSVGRGLADARARGKTILRLKVVLEEDGWTMTPGATRGNPPRPTADRLQTAITLSKECGLMACITARLVLPNARRA